MITADRRSFMQLLASGALATSLPASIARALAIPAHHRTGTIDDVEHIVILMQENRSFDHYFGTLQGVRGFSDPRPVTLTTGNPVWYQPDGASYVLPFHPPAANLGLQFIEDLPHDWITTHQAWNQGQYDQWVAAKSPLSMAYLTREDIPFHYALADAFTICDAYHCSLLGPTDPNRMHMWTGWVGNNGTGGGPALDNDGTAYSWSTFPEVLQSAGITWKIYQDVGLGLNAANYFGWAVADPLTGNYADNSLVFFTQYQNAPAGSPLYNGALTGTDVTVNGGTLFQELINDIANSALPQVSWVVAPEAFSEHPNWPANYGAWYVSQVLDALTANPAVWSKTILFVVYDENDGFFDHMVPPTPPMTAEQGLSTVNTSLELFEGNATYPAGPIGLGVRVPLLVLSPWSTGGYVNSQVFDHTSLIRFIAARFGTQAAPLTETNITPWRQTVSGDLTSAFNFASPNATVATLPSTAGYVPPTSARQPNYTPSPPAVQALPAQEPGQRRAKALPYQFNANATRFGVGEVQIAFSNTGTVGAAFQVRDGSGATAPRCYTVGANLSLADYWIVAVTGETVYDLTVFGPNGFLRQFKGGLMPGSTADLLVSSHYDTNLAGLTVQLINDGTIPYTVTAQNLYAKQTATLTIPPGSLMRHDFALTGTAGWYDVLLTVDADPDFAWRLSGHLENGSDSMTDPGIGIST
jgi:phospholipase C